MDAEHELRKRALFVPIKWVEFKLMVLLLFGGAGDDDYYYYDNNDDNVYREWGSASIWRVRLRTLRRRVQQFSKME
jgi:hypothetical protein